MSQSKNDKTLCGSGWIGQILTLLFVFSLAMPHAAAKSHEERGKDVLSLLDLEQPRLQEVRAAFDERNYDGAMELLLKYFRTREMDYHFDVDSPLRDLPGKDFDLENLMTVPSVRAMPVGVQDTTSPEDAMRQRLTFLHTTVEFEGAVDWKHQEPDREWNFMLNRHTYFLTLIEAYRRSGDERYVAEFANRLREWDEQVEPDYPRRLEVGIRVRHWTWLFPVAIQSKHFDASLLAVFLENLHGMAESLNSDGVGGYTPGNKGAMEAVAVLHAAVYFPEFRKASDWAETTETQTREQIFDSTYPDGVYRGRSPTYHNVTLREMNWFHQLMRRTGGPLSEKFEKRFHRMIDHAIAFTRPDLTVAQFGHSDRDHMKDRLLQWGKEAKRPDALWVASRGEQGQPPVWQDRIFPEGGFALLRSSWSDHENARWLMMDYGPRYRGPLRCLSLDVFAYGQPLLVAPGRYSYESEGKQLFERTRYQNTVSINEEDQDPNPNYGLARQHIDGELKLIHAWQDGYSHLNQPNKGEGKIIHERQVLMVRDRYWVVADLVRVEGDQEFTFDQNWRFMPTELKAVKELSRAVITSYEKGNVVIVPLAGEGQIHQEDSWYSPRYNVKYPAPRLSFRHKSRTGWFFVTLLAPFPGTNQPIDEMKIDASGPRSMEARLKWIDGNEDLIKVSFGDNVGDGESFWRGYNNGVLIGEEYLR